METTDNPRILRAYLQRYGAHTLAYSALQPFLKYAYDDHGVMCYRRRPWKWCSSSVSVLGDPLVHPREKPSFLAQFVQRYPRASFYHVGEDTAQCLSALGYRVASMGTESTLFLPTFRLSWNRHPSLKKNVNRARRAGVYVKESCFEAFLPEELRLISDDWVSRTVSRSKTQQFLTRPLVFQSEKDARYFFAFDQHDTLIGYRCFYPLYEDGVVVGYTADHVRIRQGAPCGTSHVLVIDALLCFQSEGKQRLHLGLAPFARQKQDQENQEVSSISRLFSGLYRYGEPLYSIRGLHQFKQSFHGDEYPAYFATRRRFYVMELLCGFMYTLGSPRQLFSWPILCVGSRVLWSMLFMRKKAYS